jgi:GntR family transcriptional regulator/MocR family aminotransferase
MLALPPMRPRDLVLPLDPAAPEPLYRQLVDGLMGVIREGRLRPGAALPSSRDLAQRCGVNRNTVLAAFRELAAEGWIEARAGSGSYVADPLPDGHPRAPQPPGAAPREAAAFDLRSHVEALSAGGAEGLDLREPWPDPGLLPPDLLAGAYHTALAYRAPEVLGARPEGEPAFRRALLPWLGERRGLWVKPGNLLETRGERAALEIAVRGLLRPGSRVLLPFPGPPGLAGKLAAWGHGVEPLSADGEGPRPEALSASEAGLVLVAPRLGPEPQPWTTARRRELLDRAAARRMPVLELEGPWELHHGPHPDLPLAAEDPHGVCLLAGGFEGLLAPGLGLGYLVGPKGPVQALTRLAHRLELRADPLLSAALARLMEDGSLAALMRRLRRAYATRGEAAARALSAGLGPAFRVQRPAMGLGLWLRPSGHLDVRTWSQAFRARGVRLPDPDPGHGGLYLGFGAFEPAAFARAVDLMAQALQAPGPA